MILVQKWCIKTAEKEKLTSYLRENEIKKYLKKIKFLRRKLLLLYRRSMAPSRTFSVRWRMSEIPEFLSKWTTKKSIIPSVLLEGPKLGLEFITWGFQLDDCLTHASVLVYRPLQLLCQLRVIFLQLPCTFHEAWHLLHTIWAHWTRNAASAKNEFNDN